MQYVIRGKNIEITEAIRTKITNTLDKITKYNLVTNEEVIHVEVRTYKENIAKISVSLDIKGKNHFLHAESEHIDLYAAIDNIRHKLEEQLRRIKERHNSRNREKFINLQAKTDLVLDEDI